jgi:hypothetical protein
MIDVVTTYPIIFEQGTPFQYVYTWETNNVPNDLTGYSAKMIIATDLVNKVPILTITSDDTTAPNTSLTLGGVAGTVTINLTDAATTAMNFDTAYYALLVQSSEEVNYKLMEGTVTVSLGLSWST